MNLATEQNIVTDLNETSSEILNIYRVPSESGYPSIVPASPEREWMNVGTAGWANRCIPLRIANQAGWCILNDAEFEVVWSGKPQVAALQILWAKNQYSPWV